MLRTTIALCAAAAFLALAAGAAADPTPVPIDSEATVGGIDVGCTGIGESKLDPKWQAYPVRVEFSDANNDYLANEVLTVRSASGAELLTVACEGPWILLKLPTGSYSVIGRVPGTSAQPRTATFRPPSHGQMRVVLKFPDL
ncbi:MAG TPA: hypothetical protein VN805_17055 [Caulobacteraceae bacterium]|nr:hypothetical protein [Caulobacteraceae bacterium]